MENVCWGFLKDDLEMVASVSELASFSQCALGDKIVEIAGDSGSRCARDGDIVFGAEAAFEAIDALTEHALDHFLLTFVQLSAQAVIELGFFDNKLDALLGVVLSFQNGRGEVGQPACDIGVLVVAFELVVIRLSTALDGVGQSDERRVSETLGE